MDVTLSQAEWKKIADYCSLNSIDDVNSFCVKCLMKGFSIEKFGESPIDKIMMEKPSSAPPKENGVKEEVKKIKKVKVVKKTVKKND